VRVLRNDSVVVLIQVIELEAALGGYSASNDVIVRTILKAAYEDAVSPRKRPHGRVGE